MPLCDSNSTSHISQQVASPVCAACQDTDRIWINTPSGPSCGSCGVLQNSKARMADVTPTRPAALSVDDKENCLSPPMTVEIARQSRHQSSTDDAPSSKVSQSITTFTSEEVDSIRNAAFQRGVGEARALVSEMQSLLAEYEATNRKISLMKETNEKLSATVDAETQKVQSLENVLQEYEKTITQMTKDKEELLNNNSNNNNNNKSIQMVPSSIYDENKALRATIDENKQAFDELKQRYDSHKTIVQNAKENENSAILRMKMIENELTNEKLRYNELKSHVDKKVDDAAAQVLQAQSNVAESVSEVLTLKTKIREVDALLIEKEAVIVRLTKDSTKLESNLKIIQDKHDLLKLEADQASGKLRDQEAAATRNKSILSEKEKIIIDKTVEIETMKKSIVSLKADVAAITAQRDDVIDERKKITEHRDQIVIDNQNFKVKVYDYNESEKKLKSQIIDLTTEIESLKTTKPSLSSGEKDNYEKTIQGLHAEILKKEGENKELHAMCDELLKTLESHK